MVDGYVMFLASDLALKRYPSITVGSTILVDNLSGPCKGSAGRVVGPPLVGGLEGEDSPWIIQVVGFRRRGAFFLSAGKAERLSIQLK